MFVLISEWCRFLLFWCWPDTSWDSFVVLILYFDSDFWGDFGDSADYLIKINGQVLEGTGCKALISCFKMFKGVNPHFSSVPSKTWPFIWLNNQLNSQNPPKNLNQNTVLKLQRLSWSVCPKWERGGFLSPIFISISNFIGQLAWNAKIIILKEFLHHQICFCMTWDFPEIYHTGSRISN
jgi:hypothetical protein